MNATEFSDRLNHRTKIYNGGRILSPDHCITLRLLPQYAALYHAQVSLIVATNLLSRMTGNLCFDIPSVDSHHYLPGQAKALNALLREDVCLQRPDQNYQFRTAKEGDYIINFGAEGGPVNVHAAGWFAYVGQSPSPFPEINNANPIGAALAAIMVVTLLFGEIPQPIEKDYLFDAYTWNSGNIDFEAYPYPDTLDLGSIWFIGLGSVGSCAAYFLPFATRNFSPTLIDHDDVEIENMDRSAIFQPCDDGAPKVEVVKQYLNSIGVDDVVTESVSFNESQLRQQRQPGTPDIFVSAANEDNVRHIIEESMPPVQVYTTTGSHWQATLLRHVPFQDACSCCVFPPTEQASESVCGGGKVELEDSNKSVDAALPFLSFMAGLMTAAEILKLALPIFPVTRHKINYQVSPKKKSPQFIAQTFHRRDGCACRTRDAGVHRLYLEKSKYGHLSGFSENEYASH